MCTLSFIARNGGYLLGMNRDERWERPRALPPRVFNLDGVRAAYPFEKSGGTWIAANQFGSAFALLNRNAPPGTRKTRSRGEIIPAMARARSIPEMMRIFDAINLRGMLPFRLVAFSPSEHGVRQWTWDGAKARTTALPWATRHWFSSGLSDIRAARGRGRTVRAAWRQRVAGSPAWLRRLHRSHVPVPGPFSVCAHRPEAGSVSYTEIRCRARHLVLRYRPGSPCQPARTVRVRLNLVQPQPSIS